MRTIWQYIKGFFGLFRFPVLLFGGLMSIPYVFIPAIAYITPASIQFEQGMVRFHNGDWEQAIKRFDKAIDYGKNYPPAILRRGQVKRIQAFYLDDTTLYNEALNDFNTYLKLDSLNVLAYRLRGWTKEGLGNFNGGIADYTKAIELNPSDTFSFFSRGFLFYRLKNYDDAIKDLDKAIELDPSNRDLYIFRSWASIECYELTEAIRDYSLILEIEDCTSDYHSVWMQGQLLTENHILELRRGEYGGYNAYHELDSTLSAIQDSLLVIWDYPAYRSAFRWSDCDYVLLDSQDSDCFHDREEGRLEIIEYTKQIALDPYPVWSFVNRAYSRIGYGERDCYGAMNDLNTAIKIKPDCADAYEERADLFKKIGKYRGALEDYKTALQLITENYDLDQDGVEISNTKETCTLHKKIAETWVSMKNLDMGILAYTDAMNSSPDASTKLELQFERGDIRKELGDLHGALEDYNSVLAKSPTYHRFSDRSDLKVKMGDIIGAIEDLNKCVELNSEDRFLYVRRGRLKETLGENDGALQDYSKAIEIYPDDEDIYLERGLVKEKLKDFLGADSDYRQAIELDPKEPLPWLQLGLFQIRAASNPKTHDLFPFTHNDGCKSLKTAIELGSKDAKKEFEKYCK